MYVPMNVRECIRHDGWSDRVQLRRRAQHFIFTVESTGCISVVDIVTEVRAGEREGEKRPTIGVIIHLLLLYIPNALPIL